MESKELPVPVVVPPEIKELSCQIEQWRSTRPYLMAMPEPLWTLAANLAKQHGLARVARFARLDYYSLKEHVARLDGDSGAEAKPTFIELKSVPAPLVCECTIELEDSKDSRMRIHIKGAPMPDIAALSRTLWGIKS
jgi:hypothetical protein